MQIVGLLPHQHNRIEQAAQVLHEVFSDSSTYSNPCWVTMDEAREEVQAFFVPDRVIRVAINEADHVLGWIGGISSYNGHAWELHPLVVAKAHQRQGVGRALVQALEAVVLARGANTLYLGSDDEDNRTSIGGVDLYPNIHEHIARIRNLHNHPYEFYLRMGFVIYGLLPDANGFGKPDILMAKRLALT
jgi:aminoglycoside 6'-N-acetyltransferase I